MKLHLFTFLLFCSALAFSQEKPEYELSRLELYKKGASDADSNYIVSKKAKVKTLILSAVSPPLGLIPAIKSTRKELSDTELNFPDKELSQNLDYYLGYTDKAAKIKKKKIWNSYLIGTGTYLVIYTVLSLIGAG